MLTNLKNSIRLSAMLLLVSPQAVALSAIPKVPPNPCLKVIKAADRALKDKDHLIKDQEALIVTLKADNTKLVVKASEEKQRADRWYKDPLISAPIGASIALGAAISPAILIAVPVFILIGLFR